VFGPKPRDYSKKVTKNVRKLAFLKALSSRILDGDVLVTEQIAVKEPKTKQLVQLLQSLTEEERVLVIADRYSEETYKAARNVRPLLLNTAAEVNTEQLLAYRKIIVTKEALSKLAERLA
jgi:large subunit ribosomal protein L4